MNEIKADFDDAYLDDDLMGSSRKRKRNAPKRIEINSNSETTAKKLNLGDCQTSMEKLKSETEGMKSSDAMDDQKTFSVFNVSNSNQNPLLNNPLFSSNSDSNNNSVGQTISITALMQALQILQQQQQLQAQQQQQLASALAFNSLVNNTNGPINNNNNNIQDSTDQLSLLLQYLPLPSPSLPTYPLLYAQYISIGNHFQSLIQMINQYNTALQQAMKSSLISQQMIKTSMPPSSESNNTQKVSSFFNNKSPPVPTQIFPQVQDENSQLWKNQPKKDTSLNSIPTKKTNFRGTSEFENLIDPNFEDLVVDKNMVRLTDVFPNILVSREIYYNILTKSSKSATRIIRLLMKHFFNQEELAASSLSGEGIYKKRLDPDVIEAIKSFIRRRHPNLKNGSISLCMTDVCVQARRVANNQRSRGQNLNSPSTVAHPTNLASPMSENGNSLSICLDHHQEDSDSNGLSPLTCNAATSSVPNLLTPLDDDGDDDDHESTNNNHSISFFPDNSSSQGGRQ